MDIQIDGMDIHIDGQIDSWTSRQTASINAIMHQPSLCHPHLLTCALFLTTGISYSLHTGINDGNDRYCMVKQQEQQQ